MKTQTHSFAKWLTNICKLANRLTLALQHTHIHTHPSKLYSDMYVTFFQKRIPRMFILRDGSSINKRLVVFLKAVNPPTDPRSLLGRTPWPVPVKTHENPAKLSRSLLGFSVKSRQQSFRRLQRI